MKSLVLILAVILLSISCKDSPHVVDIKNEKKQDTVKRLTRAERILEKTYKKQISANGDTLLSYIPQDSVQVFFTRYGKENPETKVRLLTTYGNIEMELFTETPIYRASFIYLVKNKYFNGTFVHRVVEGFVIQAGNSDETLPSLKRASAGNYKLEPHFLPNVRHERGSLSSAKQWVNNPENWHDPFDFFITLSKSPHLDNEHTIFGRVVKGMEVADAISKVEKDDSDWPKNDIFIDMEIID
ncbi:MULTISPECIES: peptidylprolyl isomerase [Nonlabens]|uniref:Peptidyl-prolyl cis-trans isomerase n=1 Tax=Nonlabens xylanidelens TaxID=191564 RepID=A0A2S6IL17_9FLAO|nr:peptidylprolyl isomerase [Nonlabens xylanidelens]PPK94850.1 peptidylprolyl isomerase [Nonlabens xylanidelens]PQJ17401.1 peptidylprolyl isomerase [Nonlabens xylanidelens]